MAIGETLKTGADDAGKRLDLLLHERLPQYSRTRLKEWVKAGRVRVNGVVEKPAYAVRGGESILVEPAELPPLKAAPEDLPLDILYEDDDVIVVNKPAGMVVHAGAGVRSGTLTNALVHHFASLSTVGGELRPGIVHRLDRYTSGVLVAARHDPAHRNLAAQFAARTVEKSYLALVHGVVKPETGRVERPIARDPVRRVRMTTRLETGRTALTEYRVRERFHDFTFLEVRIGTGRTHQIRVHLASLGHPVAGDRLYGAPAKVEGQPRLERYFLHAWRLRFRQPSSGVPVEIEALLPDELQRWLRGLTIIEEKAL